jgi:hypothetical protein
MLDRTRNPPPELWRGFVVPPALRAQYKTVKWDNLTPEQTFQVCLFALALQEVRENEMDLLRLKLELLRKGI